MFKDHQDLLEGFTYFLPDSSGSVHVSHGPTSARAASVPAVRRDERSSGLASRHPHMEKGIFCYSICLVASWAPNLIAKYPGDSTVPPGYIAEDSRIYRFVKVPESAGFG